jgi:hypothetical protein
MKNFLLFMFMERKILRKRIRLIIENIQLADKTYFKSGKLSSKVREIIVDKITGGDNYTKIITDIYYAMIQQDIKIGKWAVSVVSDDEEEFKPEDGKHYEAENDVMKLEDLKKIKNYYQQLKEYNKNVFPIKDFNINGVKDIWNLIRSLNEREKILEEIKKLPSIAIRNLKEDIRIPRNSEELNNIRKEIENIILNLSYLSNRESKVIDKIYQKIFKSGTTFKDISNFVEEKQNLLGGENVTKKQIKEIAEDSYDIEIVYEQGNIMVLEISDVSGIKQIGCNSLWCFSYGHDFNNAYRNWNNYSTNGFIYVIIDFSKKSDDADFMMVLTKPLPETEEEIEQEQENPYMLFTMDNEGVYNPKEILSNMVGGEENAEKIFNFGEEYFDKKKFLKIVEDFFKIKYQNVNTPTPSFKEFYQDFIENNEIDIENDYKIKEILRGVYDKFTKNPQQLSLFEQKIRKKIRNYFLKFNS